MRLQSEDFHIRSLQQLIRLRWFANCRSYRCWDKGLFAEYLTYEGADVALHVHWSAGDVYGAGAVHRGVTDAADAVFVVEAVAGGQVDHVLGHLAALDLGLDDRVDLGELSCLSVRPSFSRPDRESCCFGLPARHRPGKRM